GLGMISAVGTKKGGDHPCEKDSHEDKESSVLSKWSALVQRALVPGRTAVHRRDEPVAALGDRLNEPRLAGIVPEGPAQLGNRMGQDVVGDEGVRPARMDQAFLGGHLARGFRQVASALPRSGLER